MSRRPGAASRWQSFGPTEMIAIIAVFAGGIVSGMAGFAFSAIAGALMLHWVPPAKTVSLLLACSITTQMMSILSLRKSLEWGRCVPLLIGGIAGIAKILADLDPREFSAVFGGFLICYSAYTLFRPRLSIGPRSKAYDLAAGFCGGVTGGSIAFPGAIPTAWYCLQGLSKQTQRGAIQPFILIMQIVTMVYFSKLGLFSASLIGDYLWCAPATLIGTGIGLTVFRSIDDVLFRRLVLVFLLISGVILAA